MSRRPAAFTQADVARAIRAAKQAGAEFVEVRPDGTIVVLLKGTPMVPRDEDLHFHDLRGTAVTRLALSGCTVPEIAAITGHSPRDVEAILEAHYLGGRVELAEQAMMKLDAR
jgi:integrase